MTAPSMPEVYAQEGWGAHEAAGSVPKIKQRLIAGDAADALSDASARPGFAAAISGWGDAIPVDGKRLPWLPDDAWNHLSAKLYDGRTQYPCSDTDPRMSDWQWHVIESIALEVPRYDFVYLALERGMVPNMRGVRPDDWDVGEVLMRGDVMFDMECFAENDFMWRHDTSSDDIIGYHATSTALPLAHPAASTPVTLYREIDALGGVSQGPWDDGYSAALTDVLLILMKRGFSEEQDISAALPAHNINSYVDGYEDALEVAAHPAAPQGEGIELCVMVCPQCEGEGFYADGVDEAACSTECTRCRSNGWIVDTVALPLAHPAADVCASCGFPWGADPVRHAELCNNRTPAHPAAPQGEEGVEAAFKAWHALACNEPVDLREAFTCGWNEALMAVIASNERNRLAALAPAAIASGREGAE
jgi:hypothetical protein